MYVWRDLRTRTLDRHVLVVVVVYSRSRRKAFDTMLQLVSKHEGALNGEGLSCGYA